MSNSRQFTIHGAALHPDPTTGFTLYFATCTAGMLHFIESGAHLHGGQVIGEENLIGISGKADTFAYVPN